MSFSCAQRRNCSKLLLQHNNQIRNYTSPFPVRPGYGLGSFIPPGLIEGMKREAKVRSKIITFDQLCSDLESTERELLLERNQIRNNLSYSQTLPPMHGLDTGIATLQTTRQAVMAQKLASYVELVGLQSAQLHLADASGMLHETKKENLLEAESFSTFDSSIESPINWETSKISYLDRGTDSISINAHFFDMNRILQTSASYATNIAAAASQEVSSWAAPGSGYKAKIAASVHSSVTATAEAHTIESTLLLTAFATHKYVKQFKPLHTDIEQLINGWNYFHSINKIDPIMARVPNFGMIMQAMAEAKLPGELCPEISIISEEFLGSCLIGMVHFIKKDSTYSAQASYEQSFKAQEQVKAVSSLSAITGNCGLAAETAAKAASMMSSTDIDVKFNILCQGYMPKISSSKITDGIKEFKNFSPEAISASDDSGLYPKDASNQELLSMNHSATSKQSNSGAMIKATIAGLKEAYENEYKVLDYQSFMNAFDDYTKHVKNIKGGIAIGMNIKSWTKELILKAILDKWNEKNNDNKDKPIAGGGDTKQSQSADDDDKKTDDQQEDEQEDEKE